MLILLNLAALLLVVAISWFGMMWMAGRVHGKDAKPTTQNDAGRLDHPSGGRDKPCRGCKGSGAKHRMGKLEPCPVCEGTGVQPALR